MVARARMTQGIAVVCCVGFLALQPRVASAQQTNVDFDVSGTSSIRGWTCSAKGVIAVTPGTGAKPVPGFPNGVQSATVTVPVKNFQCPDDEMTQHLMEAMHADTFSQITFRLEKYDVAGAQAEATGSITITDVTGPISFPVTLKASGQGVQVEGNTRLDMTKFGVDPPVVMFGLLKVGPQIRIDFKGVVAPK